jgi:hypothetical protein
MESKTKLSLLSTCVIFTMLLAGIPSLLKIWDRHYGPISVPKGETMLSRGRDLEGECDEGCSFLYLRHEDSETGEVRATLSHLDLYSFEDYNKTQKAWIRRGYGATEAIKKMWKHKEFLSGQIDKAIEMLNVGKNENLEFRINFIRTHYDDNKFIGEIMDGRGVRMESYVIDRRGDGKLRKVKYSVWD